MARLILTGDVNLMNVEDPAVPFRQVAAKFRDADMVFSNRDRRGRVERCEGRRGGPGQ
jgi:hypothetical protein